MPGILSESYIAIGSKFYETLREFEVFSPGLLVFWPAAWSLTLVAMRTQMPPEQYGLQLAAFLLQTVVGYNVGNLWEKFAVGAFSPVPKTLRVKTADIREQAQRTSFVVLAFEALIFSTLIWPLNGRAFWNAMLSLTAISVASPLLKWVSFWPRAVLSIAMNWFIVVAWVANADVDWKVLSTLLFASLCWTSHYNIYRREPERTTRPPPSENPSSARRQPNDALLVTSRSLACIGSLTAVGILTAQDSPFFLLSVLGGAAQLAWQVAVTDRRDPRSRLSAFVSNGTCFGPIVWAGMFINYLNGQQGVVGYA